MGEYVVDDLIITIYRQINAHDLWGRDVCGTILRICICMAMLYSFVPSGTLPDSTRLPK